MVCYEACLKRLEMNKIESQLSYFLAFYYSSNNTCITQQIDWKNPDFFAVSTIGKKPKFPSKLQQYCPSEANVKNYNSVGFFPPSMNVVHFLYYRLRHPIQTHCFLIKCFPFTCCLILTHCSSSGSSPPSLCSPSPSAAALFKLTSVSKVPF